MMSGNQIIMSRSLKRKIVIDGESLSETSQGTAKKNAQYCTGTTLSYSEETEEEIKIVFESEKIVLESDEANSVEEYLKLNTSEFKLDTSKYKTEFFKHCFLPSTRKRNNRYTRNDPKKSNSPISDAELRVLYSGIALSNPGDIMQLTEYPASNAEIGCHHRILSGGSSRKLISRRDEQNLKKKYCQDKLRIVHQPVKLLYLPGFSVITENLNVPSDSEIEILSDSVCGKANFDDDSCDSSSANMSQMSENSHACSVMNNSGNKLDIPLSSDKSPFSSVHSNYDSVINATNFSLQRNVSDCSLPLGEAIQDITNFNRAQQTTITDGSVISSHFHTASTDIAINKSILALSNSNSKKNTVTYNLQPNSPVHSSVSVDEMQNGVINGAKTAATGKAYNISSDFYTNVPFDELQKALDTIKSLNDSDKSSQNEIVSVNNSSQYFLNTVVNSCVTNESTLASTNLSSSCTTYYPNEINVPYEELQKAVDTIKKVFGNHVGCQNEMVSVGNDNVQHFINAGSKEYVAVETIKFPTPLATKENSDDEYEEFEPYYNDTDLESTEGNSTVSSGRTSLLSTEDMEGHEFVATENINLLPDKENNKFPFYINNKGMEIEKSKYDGFAYGITDSKTNSCDFNESLTNNEKFFCNINSEKEAATEVAKAPLKDISCEKIDDLNLLEPEKLTYNSTPKETIEATKDSNDKETDDINLLESKKPIENSISIETVEDSKSAEKKMSQHFYGNRVSNRGTFLTQKRQIKPLPKPKISKGKTFEVNRNLNTNPEELHALIKTPDINIDLSRLHSYGNRHKCIDSSRNRPHKSLGISSHSDLRIRSLEVQHNTPRNSHCQVYAGNNTKQNTGLPHAPVSTTSPVLFNNNMPVQGTALNACVPPTNFMPVSHLNSLSVSDGHRTSEYDVNRFPCFPLAPTYAFQHPFQPYASPRIPTSIHPFQLQSYMHPRFLSPDVHPSQLAFQTYVDPRNRAESFMLHNSFDCASKIESERMNEDSNNYTTPINTACSQGTTVMLPPNTPRDTAISSSSANDVSSKCFDKEKEASEIQVSNRKCFPKTSSNSDIPSSPSFKTFVAHTDEISGKPKCLVPSHMKYYIGSKSFKTEDIRLLMLEWDVDSIIHHQNSQESPPIYCNFKKLSSSYESFEDYYNTLFPLLMLETWERVCTSSSRLNVTKPFSAEIISYDIEKDYVIVKCKTVYNADPDSHPEAGSIVIVNYGTKSIEHTVKIFGYLIQSKLRRFNPETDTDICKYSSQHADTESSTFPVLMFTFIAAYDSEHINTQLPMRIEVLYALKYNLKQHDALLFVKNSPFEKYILKPNTEGLLRLSLNTENSEDEISKCVEKVMEKILPIPILIPIITMIKTNTDSDHLKIIPLLIQRIKNNCSNMKVIVCVRTRGTIADIASKLTSQRDLKFIIVCKRCNISPKFREFLLDDLVKKKIKHIKEIQVERKVAKEEVFKIKKEIVLDSDVVMSWARDIHNDAIARVFSETKSIDNMCCIIDEAHSFTEPETLIPTLYGIKKLILIGNAVCKAKVLSETAIAHDFDKSYFHRAYDPVTSPD